MGRNGTYGGPGHRVLTGVALFCLLWLAAGLETKAQNFHFSQFFNSPLTTNPANTGFIPEADFRLGANYRDQWSSIPVPYRTVSVWGDAQAFRNVFPTGWVGLGGILLQDQAGSGNLRTTRAYGSAAYHQMINNTGLLSAGFNVGVVNKRIDVSKLTFPDQWNGIFFDGTLLTSESFQATNITYMDFQMGLNYAYFPTDDVYLHAGLAVAQINRPKESLFTFVSNGYNRVMDRRYTLFLDGMVKLNDRWILTPAAYLTRQSLSMAMMGGMHVNYNLSGDGEHQLIAGAYHRLGDAVIPLVGYQWKNFRFTFSYDATVSDLGDYIYRKGANEMSLLHSGFYTSTPYDKRQSLCPKF